MNRVQSRLLWLDFLKGLAVLAMIFQHSVIIAGDSSLIQSQYGKLVFIVGTLPAAPVFLWAFGYSVGFKKRSYLYYIQRIFKLLALGYLINLFSLALPASISNYFFGTDLPIINLLARVEILQLAGACLLGLMIAKGWLDLVGAKGRKFRWLLIVGYLAIAMAGSILKKVDNSNSVLDYLSNFLVATDAYGAFGIIPWASFFLLGIISRSYNLLDKLDWIITLILSGIGVWYLFPTEHSYVYAHMNFIELLLASAFVLVYVVFIRWLSQKLPIRFTSVVADLGAKVTRVYFFQWVIYGVIGIFFPLSMPIESLLAACLVTIASVGLSRLEQT
ncbi:DUF1624 domain-containing protein [Candidatus Saccharibacteria bacterium]|nr:DUF1624 domain-containing protein [Candidatus Saccharibacteria bacterium]MCB9834556.1 DUF1624 domain-containing protein [Candidatus Nomurabacteria bacterium]